MQSRVYFSGLGTAFLQRFSNPARGLRNGFLRFNFSTSGYQRHEWASLRDVPRSTGIKSREFAPYEKQLQVQNSSSKKDFDIRERAAFHGLPNFRRLHDWKRERTRKTGSIDKKQIPRSNQTSKEEDYASFKSSHEGPQAGVDEDGFQGPGSHTTREPPSEIAKNEVLRILHAHGPLRFKSIAGYLDTSLPVFSTKLQPSMVRTCLQLLENEQKVKKISLKKELYNNHGKIVEIEQLHWVAGSRANRMQALRDNVSGDGSSIQSNLSDGHHESNISVNTTAEKASEVFWTSGSEEVAEQSSEAPLDETLDFSTYSCKISPELSRENVNSLSIARSTGRKYLTPPQFLARWLDSKETSERYFSNEIYWEKANYSSSLPTILVEYMYQSKRPKSALLTAHEASFQATASGTLKKAGFTMEDVASWANIVSAPDTEEVINRFLSTKTEKPTFLLLEILRRDMSHVRSLKLLLIYTWDQIMGNPCSNLTTLSETEIDARIPWSEVSNFSQRKTDPVYKPNVLEETTYTMILTRLLHHIRLLWPPALVSLSHMVSPIMFLNYGIGSSETKSLNRRNHHRACKLLNHMIRLLSLPTSINPYKSMTYNWEAQKVLLGLAEQFEPPLFLDQISYGAIMSVLTAQKKSENESKVSKFRARSWPPWRIDQDGMDAQRSIEDDFSRAVAATTQAKESGYQEDTRGRASKILGGQEPDGTPTIQTRKLMMANPGKIYRPLKVKRFELAPVDHHEWAARIVATRDVQEAWAAFSRFQEQGGTPSLSMYQAMLEKLIYEKIRAGRKAPYEAPAGDGREVFPPANDNFSMFYQQSLQPPTIAALYNRMIEQPGPRPAGRFLNLLVSTARTPWEGLRYLFHSRMLPKARHFLKNPKDIDPHTIKDHLPHATLAAFISLLCRFAPRAVTHYSSDSRLMDSAELSQDSKDSKNDMAILEIAWVEGPSPGMSNPLRHAVELLKQTQTRFRPAWYALFKTLALHDVLVDKKLVGNPKNDMLKWRVMVAALNDFHQNGLELDPDGFLSLCRCLENAILASFKIPEEERKGNFGLGSSQILIVVNEFMKLSETIPSPEAYQIPQLLHTISGVHLHAYVRILGLTEDYDGMMFVLEWMVANHDSLEKIAFLSRNGPKLTRRTFTAMRVFFRNTEYENKAEELVNSIERWDGWPSEGEAQQYTERWSRNYREDQKGALDEIFNDDDPDKGVLRDSSRDNPLQSYKTIIVE